MMETRSKPALHSAITVPVVRKLLHRGARSRLARILTKAYPVEVARLLSTLKGSERAHAFEILLDESDVAHVADVMSEMSQSDSLPLLERLEPAQIAKYLSEMPADRRNQPRLAIARSARRPGPYVDGSGARR